ncbi:DUF2384 domain-containing protein [Roseivivax sp. GX 12232]|uniref:antitoxin Xre-like helix-turn-helix domain-containing protein n=1 Tax=Roseivivax sp. GX 12232 TaxID=2900547 RepID=UPI001E2C6834|nr:antitoxin Xre-like helix-turn-helix domain-containing protein [Roseivivax sp. GX 12232]MCE0507284.1 DUF2384 domain-containing protein [Roseivivax sp. GX 12232]
MSAQFATDTGIQPLSDRDKVATLVKAVARATSSWGLTSTQSAALFDVPPATWARMKSATFIGTLDRDKVTRASLIIGIYKGLRLLFNGPLITDWPTLPNKGPFYEGRSPIDLMIAQGIPGMVGVRQHIDAMRVGV